MVSTVSSPGEPRLSAPAALPQHVLGAALERLSKLLVAPNDQARKICEELRTDFRAINSAVLERLAQEKRCLSSLDSSDSLSQEVEENCVEVAMVGYDGGTNQSARPMLCSITPLVQDLSCTFFSREVLDGEKSLGDDRVRLTALRNKLKELSAERDHRDPVTPGTLPLAQTLARYNVSPKERELFAALAGALESSGQKEHGDGAGSERLKPSRACGATKIPARTNSSSCHMGNSRGMELPSDSVWESPVQGKLPETLKRRLKSKNSPSAASPPSRLQLPRAGRRRRFLLTSPTSTASRGAHSDSSSSAPPSQRPSLSPFTPPSTAPIERGVCHRCGGRSSSVFFHSGLGESMASGEVDTAGDEGSPSSSSVKSRLIRSSGSGGGDNRDARGKIASAGDGVSVTAPSEGESMGDWHKWSHEQLKQEVGVLRGQRDALTRSLSFARKQHGDELGAKALEIERLTKAVDSLQRASDAQQVRLEESRRAHAEEVARLQHKLSTQKSGAAGAAARLEEESSAKVVAEARIVTLMAEHASAVEVLEQKMLVLEEKSKSTSTENERLASRLDGAFHQVEELLKTNEALRSEAGEGRRSAEEVFSRETTLLRKNAAKEREQLSAELHVAETKLAELQEEVASLRDLEQLATSTANGLRASLFETRADADRAREAASAVTVQATSATELAAVRKSLEDELEVVKQELSSLQKKYSQIERQLDNSREETAAVTSERNAWAVRSGEWEAEASRLEEALQNAETDAARVKEELRAELMSAQSGLAETSKNLVGIERLRAHDAAAIGAHEKKLENALETAQTLRSEASKGRELVAMAREDARESRLCKQQLEKDLAEATHELDRVQSECQRASQQAEERIASMELETDELRDQVKAMSSRTLEVEGDLARERTASAALAAENANLERARDQDHSSAADALKATRVELETCRKALEDAREVIVERTEDLRAVEKQAETSTRAAASEALAAAVREKTEAIRELEEVSRSRVKEESDCAEAIAVVERKARKKLLTMAEDTAAAKKARARYAADLAIAKEDRGRLEERSKESQATIENLEASLAELQERTLGIEGEKHAAQSALQRAQGMEVERAATISSLEKALSSQRTQLASMTSAHEDLEHRLAAAENGVASSISARNVDRREAADRERRAAERLDMEIVAYEEKIREASEAAQAEVQAANARAAERAQAASTELAAVRRELTAAIETSTGREGQIAELRARLRATEEEVETARRDAQLEARAKWITEMTNAGKRITELQATVEESQRRSGELERTVADLTSSHQEEMQAYHAARASLERERLASGKSRDRVHELELEIDRLLAALEMERKAGTMLPSRNLRDSGSSEYKMNARSPRLAASYPSREPTESSRYKGLHHCSMEGRAQDRYGNDLPPEVWLSWDSAFDEQLPSRERSGGAGIPGSGIGTREARERERTRAVIYALEDAVRSARGETSALTRRVTLLRAGFRDAERRANDMEAAAASARASAAVAEAASAGAMAEVEVAVADRREMEQKARAAERREAEKTTVLMADLQRARDETSLAQERLKETKAEVCRLRGQLGDSDRRALVLEERMTILASDLRAAEAERAQAQINLLHGLGRDKTRGDLRGSTNTDRRSVVRHREVGETCTESRSYKVVPGMFKDSRSPGAAGSIRAARELSVCSGLVTEDSNRGIEELRERLAACRAQLTELLSASEEALSLSDRRCDTRIRVTLAAGTLASACCRWRGIAAGREETLEAAARLSLMRRCFGSLSREALRSSRDRILRRHNQMRRWVKEAVEAAGEEFALTIQAKRRGKRDNRNERDTKSVVIAPK